MVTIKESTETYKGEHRVSIRLHGGATLLPSIKGGMEWHITQRQARDLYEELQKFFNE